MQFERRRHGGPPTAASGVTVGSDVTVEVDGPTELHIGIDAGSSLLVAAVCEPISRASIVLCESVALRR